ncbi:hypothetical protein G210_2465, partial [Candida maltosa Xu316]
MGSKIKLKALLIPKEFEQIPQDHIDPSKFVKFLYIANKEATIKSLEDGLVSRFSKRYPNERKLKILSFQDRDLCDLDPDFAVEDVFDDQNNEIRVLANNKFKKISYTPESNLSTPIDFSRTELIPGGVYAIKNDSKTGPSEPAPSKTGSKGIRGKNDTPAVPAPKNKKSNKTSTQSSKQSSIAVETPSKKNKIIDTEPEKASKKQKTSQMIVESESEDDTSSSSEDEDDEDTDDFEPDDENEQIDSGELASMYADIESKKGTLNDAYSFNPTPKQRALNKELQINMVEGNPNMYLGRRTKRRAARDASYVLSGGNNKPATATPKPNKVQKPVPKPSEEKKTMHVKLKLKQPPAKAKEEPVKVKSEPKDVPTKSTKDAPLKPIKPKTPPASQDKSKPSSSSSPNQTKPAQTKPPQTKATKPAPKTTPAGPQKSTSEVPSKELFTDIHDKLRILKQKIDVLKHFDESGEINGYDAIPEDFSRGVAIDSRFYVDVPLDVSLQLADRSLHVLNENGGHLGTVSTDDFKNEASSSASFNHNNADRESTVQRINKPSPIKKKPGPKPKPKQSTDKGASAAKEGGTSNNVVVNLFESESEGENERKLKFASFDDTDDDDATIIQSSPVKSNSAFDVSKPSSSTQPSFARIDSGSESDDKESISFKGPNATNNNSNFAKFDSSDEERNNGVSRNVVSKPSQNLQLTKNDNRNFAKLDDSDDDGNTKSDLKLNVTSAIKEAFAKIESSDEEDTVMKDVEKVEKKPITATTAFAQIDGSDDENDNIVVKEVNTNSTTKPGSFAKFDSSDDEGTTKKDVGNLVKKPIIANKPSQAFAKIDDSDNDDDDDDIVMKDVNNTSNTTPGAFAKFDSSDVEEKSEKITENTTNKTQTPIKAFAVIGESSDEDEDTTKKTTDKVNVTTPGFAKLDSSDDGEDTVPLALTGRSRTPVNNMSSIGLNNESPKVFPTNFQEEEPKNETSETLQIVHSQKPESDDNIDANKDSLQFTYVNSGDAKFSRISKPAASPFGKPVPPPVSNFGFSTSNNGKSSSAKAAFTISAKPTTSETVSDAKKPDDYIAKSIPPPVASQKEPGFVAGAGNLVLSALAQVQKFTSSPPKTQKSDSESESSDEDESDHSDASTKKSKLIASTPVPKHIITPMSHRVNNSIGSVSKPLVVPTLQTITDESSKEENQKENNEVAKSSVDESKSKLLSSLTDLATKGLPPVTEAKLVSKKINKILGDSSDSDSDSDEDSD